MSTNYDDSYLARREFLRSAAAITTGCLVVGKPSRSVDLLFQPPGHVLEMTFDVTQTPMACTFKPTQSGTDCTLTVNDNDEVHWKAKTVQSKHHLTVLFTDDTPFRDSAGNKVWAFHGSESDEASGIGKNAHIQSGLTVGKTFKFLAGVWDGADGDPSQKTYASDPTIIIGKGGSNLATAIALLNAADSLLKKAAALETTESANIQSAAKEVADIIGRLEAQLTPQAK